MSVGFYITFIGLLTRRYIEQTPLCSCSDYRHPEWGDAMRGRGVAGRLPSGGEDVCEPGRSAMNSRESWQQTEEGQQ
jgi:hypothetical protein